MSDVMRIQPFATQLRRILVELERNASIFDIHRSLFWKPVAAAPFAVQSLFGKFLATPVGPSAGPHTQLSQNIVASWLCGGRFIELKTVQVMDELVIPRPCIDMTDEGYNVEWSQELKLEESAHEYVVAWALVHLLPRILGWEELVPAGESPGAIFDMSLGYNLEGIRQPRMSTFMDTLADASAALEPILGTIARDFPGFADIAIPTRIANSVTLSTMHGCPPDEIERIARYLLEERGLHTVVKLNPTLLGKERILDILHNRLGFHDIDIPDAVFEHDLQYDQALALITSLKNTAAALGLTFGVKLTNTLAVRNHAGWLPGDEMYMSGRALYPVTMALYDRLLHAFDGDLHVSYSAGADADNVATILRCGALPVTGCTDFLKPGGFARMTQWVETLGEALQREGVSRLDIWSANRLSAVRTAAAAALQERRYKKSANPYGLPKVASGLGLWDCVVAPCVEACAVEQDVPEYAWLIAEGQYDWALEVILARNPLPGVTGYVCNRLCQTRCTRNDYEETVAIRALKRIAEERGRAEYLPHRQPPTGRRVAIVGSGPSGLAAAAYLALNGVQATIFESRDTPGGMMRAVPPFRLPTEIIDRDIARIAALGVELRLNTRITVPPEELLEQGFDAVYLASGFQRDAPLTIPGAEGERVLPALHLLDRARRGERVDLGSKVAVVGGGDTAMDAVRTSQRLTGVPVTILYRRTRREMPAAEEELEGALEEGNLLEELVSPLAVLREGDRVVGVRCVRNELGLLAADGRRGPVPIPGSEFVVPCDTVVVAVGQLPELTFLDGSRVSRHAGGGVLVDGPTRGAGPEGGYAGGDVVIEPGSIISACADGRKAAEAICEHLGLPFAQPAWQRPVLSQRQILDVKAVRARRVPQVKPAMLAPERRGGFDLIESTYTEAEARAEGLRCVQCTAFCDKCVEVCPNRANYTFRIEPVSWRVPILGMKGGKLAVVGEEAFVVVQDRQILHVDDFCNECDDCQTFCVHHGKPYIDKPRLFLDQGLFEAEASNAFRIEGHAIRRRENAEESRLIIEDDGLVYEDAALRVRLSPDWRVAAIEAKEPFAGTRSLKPAAEMALLYRGITGSLGFLLIG
ncbi:MAG: putative selenate reductase subunit YgfK [Acidobacteria bacterium]|nr:MAG: putative selenate reductase subunit YgfK [Acidobacteriota bacterium]